MSGNQKERDPKTHTSSPRQEERLQESFTSLFSIDLTAEQMLPFSSPATLASHVSSSGRKPTKERESPQFYVFNDDYICLLAP